MTVFRRCPRRFQHEVVHNHRRQPAGAREGSARHRDVEDRLRDGVGPGHLRGRRLVAAELPVRLKVGAAVLHGRIDAVIADEAAGGWELVDFKSGAAPAVSEPADELQLEVYALAVCAEHGRAIEAITTTYFYLASGEARSRSWSRADLHSASARLAIEIEAIASDEFPARPNRTCWSCGALELCKPGMDHLAGGPQCSS